MMKHAVVMVALAACGTDDPVTQSSAQQAVVLEAPDPGELVNLARCIEMPDPLTAEWIRDRLTYHRSCFESWAVRVPIECSVKDHVVGGSIVVAGDAMAKVPQTGLLIRARAASAALLDLATLVNGDLVRPRVDVEVGAGGMSMSGCVAPVDGGGVQGDLQMVAEIPSLGTTTIGGAVELARIDGTWTSDFELAITAEGVEGPRVSGELRGTGIARDDNADVCPDAGEVRFSGSIDDTTSEVVLSYLGDDHVVIALPDGSQVGPFVPSSCR